MIEIKVDSFLKDTPDYEDYTENVMANSEKRGCCSKKGKGCCKNNKKNE